MRLDLMVQVLLLNKLREFIVPLVTDLATYSNLESLVTD